MESAPTTQNNQSYRRDRRPRRSMSPGLNRLFPDRPGGRSLQKKGIFVRFFIAVTYRRSHKPVGADSISARAEGISEG